MQWVLLGAWGALVWRRGATPRAANCKRMLLAAGLCLSMGTQLTLLWMDGRLTLQTALPLHLCGLFGVLSVPLLWRGPKALYEAQSYLASPAALAVLFFPAPAPCSHPTLMLAAFSSLHALLALMPLYRLREGKPLPTNPHRTLLLGNGYLLFVGAFNRVFDTNYLFLRGAPTGTPLSALFAQGTSFYLCALEMLCMLLFSWLTPLFIAGNRSSYSRSCFHSAPCTTQRRA